MQNFCADCRSKISACDTASGKDFAVSCIQAALAHRNLDLEASSQPNFLRGLSDRGSSAIGVARPA